MTHENQNEETQLRTREQIDQEYAGLALMAGDLSAKIPYMQEALSVALTKMNVLLKEPAAPKPPGVSDSVS